MWQKVMWIEKIYCVKSGAEGANEMNDTFILNTESLKRVIFGMRFLAPREKIKKGNKVYCTCIIMHNSP